MSFNLNGNRGVGDFISAEGDNDEVVSEINTTPLVDIMLVLLIIFLITIPVATHAVKVDIPERNSHLTQTKVGNIALVIKADGQVFWNEQLLPDENALKAKLASVASLHPQPQIQVWGDIQAKFEKVGQVIQDCQQAGISRVDFITKPIRK
ncbi:MULTISPECIES: biopolymer transporter ExbD [Commensalibacter]|uniref:ExbD/TolR family protein n=1 Tax=Commensalibacter TaxID=1079922 RepID=UPI0012D98D63|nr:MULTISPECIES: biopolymer transporter ExbD [Commensalibacter]MBH9969692.1 biopolymer transporter ExbD [Commensalibacter sp. M0265]MBH9977412.1 biopolymer transporter ExbD [Commensalibacter sp. M0266]MBH9992727.1 biopolymer transporter ExbD [Commensalibacter sp. M0270]MBI0046588.1 biopolymer transporter ExbD [Commensalibacter sp. M0267]MBI0055892.1 biopolymer transporter ExbD [Commensalibacter sp. M0268]